MTKNRQKQAKKPLKRETFLPKKSFFSGKATKTPAKDGEKKAEKNHLD